MVWLRSRVYFNQAMENDVVHCKPFYERLKPTVHKKKLQDAYLKKFSEPYVIQPSMKRRNGRSQIFGNWVTVSRNVTNTAARCALCVFTFPFLRNGAMGPRSAGIPVSHADWISASKSSVPAEPAIPAA